LKILSDHHLFILPSQGEGFGHAILEALSAGCPVLISDKTPWRGLFEQGVGWDLDLQEIDKFRAAIQEVIYMSGLDFANMSSNAREYAQKYGRSQTMREQHIQMFGLP
jgi:glycosyltransferase involved in cell wall biosynthesis